MQKLHLAVTAALALAVGGCSSPSADVAIAMADAVVPAAHASTMSASVQSRAVTTPLLQADPVADQLAALRDIAPKADPGVLALALEARQCAVEHGDVAAHARLADRKSTRLNSSHVKSSYAVFCLKKNTSAS